MMQSAWATLINPVINNPANNSLILRDVTLISGTTQVNHKLGRKLIGWKIIRQRAAADIFDTQDTNQMPDLTLSLVSSALVSVDLEVF